MGPSVCVTVVEIYQPFWNISFDVWHYYVKFRDRVFNTNTQIHEYEAWIFWLKLHTVPYVILWVEVDIDLKIFEK